MFCFKNIPVNCMILRWSPGSFFVLTRKGRDVDAFILGYATNLDTRNEFNGFHVTTQLVGDNLK